MESDLFSARDAAALLAIRRSLDEGPLCGETLRAAFATAGLMREEDETQPTGRPPRGDDRTAGHAKRAA